MKPIAIDPKTRRLINNNKTSKDRQRAATEFATKDLLPRIAAATKAVACPITSEQIVFPYFLRPEAEESQAVTNISDAIIQTVDLLTMDMADQGGAKPMVGKPVPVLAKPVIDNLGRNLSKLLDCFEPAALLHPGLRAQKSGEDLQKSAEFNLELIQTPLKDSRKRSPQRSILYKAAQVGAYLNYHFPRLHPDKSQEAQTIVGLGGGELMGILNTDVDTISQLTNYRFKSALDGAFLTEWLPLKVMMAIAISCNFDRDEDIRDLSLGQLDHLLFVMHEAQQWFLSITDEQWPYRPKVMDDITDAMLPMLDRYEALKGAPGAATMAN